MASCAVHDVLLAWGAWRTREAGKVRSSRWCTQGPAVFESFFQCCPLCHGLGHIRNGVSEVCPACDGKGRYARRMMLADPATIRRTGPGGMGYHDPGNRRLNSTPAIFSTLEGALSELSRDNLAVIWSRYVIYPKSHAVKRNVEQVGGMAARLAWINDEIRPHTMTRTQYGDRLTRIKRRLSEALNLSVR